MTPHCIQIERLLEVMNCSRSAIFFRNASCQFLDGNANLVSQGEGDASCQALRRHLLERNGFWPSTRFGDHLAPEWLVAEERYHDRRSTEGYTCCCRPCASVVHYAGDALEEPVLVSSAFAAD
jgi:hypothetical protein